ncbi:MAG: histidine kinase dimerization/phosphoacceptor domain -containing protein, partial [Methanobacteriota archaeon]
IILLFVCLIILGLMFFSQGTIFRRQIFLMFVGVLAPFSAIFLNNIFHNIIPIDFTPFTLVITGLTIFPAVTRYNVLNIIPVAHATVFKTLGSGLIVLDRLGKVREMNPASEEIFQVNGSEVIGQEARSSLIQGDLLSELAQCSIPTRGELVISDTQRSEFYLVDVMPLTEGGTVKTGSVLMITPITDQKKKEEQLVEYSGIIENRNTELNSAYKKIQAAYGELKQNQDALKESEQSLQKAQKIAHLGSFEWNNIDAQIYASDEFKRIFGIPALNPPPVVENLTQYIERSDHDLYNSSIKALIESEVSFAIDFVIVRGDGSRCAVRGLGEIEDDDAEVTHYTLIVQDITDQKLMEEEIQEASLEKETLLREIHHRVKNNMQIISSLLSMQSRTIKDPVIQSLFKETQTRVRSLALVHEHLYQSKNLNKINYQAYLQKITTYLFHSYEISTEAVICTIEVQNIEFSIEKAVPCSLIITELLTNSFKYAFIDGRKGEIHIGISLNPDTKEYVLDYRDNGQGFPIGFDPMRNPGFGSTLITGLTGQLSGTVRVEPVDCGVHYRITFPSSTGTPNHQ